MQPDWLPCDRGPRLPPSPSEVEAWARTEARGPHGAEELLARVRLAERERPARNAASAFWTNLAAALLGWWIR